MEEPIRTLPAWTYRTPEFLEAERREVFRKQWVMVGHVSELQEPGDYVSQTVAGEPIVAVRGKDGELRAFSNVCRHRGARVADGSATAARRCAAPTTAGRTASTAGCWACPRSRVPGFDKDANGLGRSAAACWRGSCSPTWIPIPSR